MERSFAQLILPIKIAKSSERLTSLGGLVVREELARGVRLWEEVDRVVEGPKSGRGYQPRESVRALVWMLHAGGRRLEDLREFQAEHEVLKESGLEAVPDAGTVGDGLRRQGEAGAEAMKKANQNLPERAWTPYRTPDDIATDRQIAETVHSMNGTEQAFRLIVLRWPNPQPNLFEDSSYCYHALATNRDEAAGEVIWKHNGRGQSENWHKELKSGVGMEVAAATRAGNSRPTRCTSPSGCWRITWPNC